MFGTACDTSNVRRLIHLYVSASVKVRMRTRILQLKPELLYTVSVPVFLIRTRVRHFELHLTMISCQISDGLDLIWRDNTLNEK